MVAPNPISDFSDQHPNSNHYSCYHDIPIVTSNVDTSGLEHWSENFSVPDCNIPYDPNRHYDLSCLVSRSSYSIQKPTDSDVDILDSHDHLAREPHISDIHAKDPLNSESSFPPPNAGNPCDKKEK